MSDLLTAILKDTYSLSQLKHRLRILKSSLLKTFFGGPTSPASTEDLNWLKSLPITFYQKFNKDNIYNIISDLEEETAKLVTLVVYLTFEPDDATLSQIGAFARKIYQPSLILEIKLDPNLIAGTALVWKGVYKDYSLRAKIEERKIEISEGFKKFLR